MELALDMDMVSAVQLVFMRAQCQLKLLQVLAVPRSLLTRQLLPRAPVSAPLTQLQWHLSRSADCSQRQLPQLPRQRAPALLQVHVLFRRLRRLGLVQCWPASHQRLPHLPAQQHRQHRRCQQHPLGRANQLHRLSSCLL